MYIKNYKSLYNCADVSKEFCFILFFIHQNCNTIQKNTNTGYKIVLFKMNSNLIDRTNIFCDYLNLEKIKRRQIETD